MLKNAKYIDSILSPEFQIEKTTYIKNGVNFGDQVWDFYNPNTVRRSSIPKTRYKFDWKYVENNIGKSMSNDLKVLTFFLIVTPRIFNKKSMVIPTIHEDIWLLQHVIRDVIAFEQELIKNSYDPSFINLADLKIHQFEKVSIHKSRFVGFKKVLKYLINPFISNHLSNKIPWAAAEIDTIKMKILPKESFKEIASTPIDTKFYSEIVKQVTADLMIFKRAMKMKVFAGITSNIELSIQESKSINLCPDSFNMYHEILKKDEYESIIRSKRYSGAYVLRKDFKTQFNYSVKEFNDTIRRFHGAAILSILLFTGMRYSELISLQKNCIEKRADVFVIKGTVIKHRSENLSENMDEWVAIPIVRDAIDVLQQIQLLTNNSSLVAPLRRVYLNIKNEPLSENGLTTLLNKYIEYRKSEDNSFEDFDLTLDVHHLTSHRFRHSLAQQLVRGRLGIPYISYHFKHVNTALVAYNKIMDVTIGYGGISKELFNSAKNYKDAKSELFEQIYSPTAVVVGGQNATEFMKRKTEYFQGLLVNDEEISEIIDDLKSQSLPFLDVGLGYCGGRKDKVLKDGTKEPPPCIGQLKCNPLDCGNAVIPRAKLPVWKKLHEDTLTKLNDSSYNYMKLELKATLERTEVVLNHFR